MDRRTFLKKLAIYSSVMAIPAPIQALAAKNERIFDGYDIKRVQKGYDIENKRFWSQPREVYVKLKETDEVVRALYWKDGDVVNSGYQDLCWLMRDFHVNEAIEMDVQLLNLMYAMQSWLGMYGTQQPLSIHSAYRSPETNRNTAFAATKSLHMTGQALDFSVEDVRGVDLLRLAGFFGAGGLGFYPRRSTNFIHMDTGDVRYWGFNPSHY